MTLIEKKLIGGMTEPLVSRRTNKRELCRHLDEELMSTSNIYAYGVVTPRSVKMQKVSQLSHIKYLTQRDGSGGVR
jgi:hypothetical protein